MRLQLPTQTLSAAEEVQLAMRVEGGVYAATLLDAGVSVLQASRSELEAVVADGRAAWDEFYSSNLRLVMSVAFRWAKWYRLEVEEVFQEGCLGLAEAIRRWDYARGLRFATYGWKWVTNYVRRACLLRCGALDAPEALIRTQSALLRRTGQLQSELGCSDVIEFLAAELEKQPAWVADILSWTPPSVTDELSAADWVVTPPAIPLDVGLARLSNREQYVISARFGLGCPATSYAALARQLHLSVRSVKAIETGALARMRTVLDPAAA